MINGSLCVRANGGEFNFCILVKKRHATEIKKRASLDEADGLEVRGSRAACLFRVG